jgi:hypothetical protein
MKLLIQAAMIFFGTLIAAGLLALGEPGSAASSVRLEPPSPYQAPALENSWRSELTSSAQSGR